MSENPEDDFLSKWREAWKTEEGKDRLMHFFRRVPRLPAPGPLAQWRPLIPEPEPKPKHDGKLDEDYQVYQSNGAWGFEGVVIEYKGTANTLLTPKRALSLLAWLEQERETLEQLAKEQEASKTKQEEKPARKIIAKVARVTSLLPWEVDYIFDNCHCLLNWKDEWGARPLSGNTIEIEYDEAGVAVHARVLHGGLV